MTRWLVIAWLDQRPAVTGYREGRYGRVTVVEAAPWPRAAVWCGPKRYGPAERTMAHDHARACYTADQRAQVFELPATETDPLGRARALILEAAGLKAPATYLDADGDPR